MRGDLARKWLVLAALLALFATACSGGGGGGGGEDTGGEATPGETTGAEEGEGEGGGEFSMYIGEPESLVPTNTNETSGSEVLRSLFTALVDYDPETSEPLWGEEAGRAMAESIESEDQQTWTITLKEGWTFHNGEPVTAQSFVDSWNYGAYGPNAQGNSYFFENIEGYDDLQCPAAPEGSEEAPPCDETTVTTKEMSGLEVIDDTTFEVTLNAPFSQFPLTVGYTAFYPMPEEAFSDAEGFNEAPIGNGPFQMDGTWTHNQNIRVTRYPDYQGEPAKAEAVEFRIYSEIDTAYNDLVAGNLDIMDQVPPEQAQAAETEFGDRFITRPSSQFTYIGFPMYRPEFQNADLRKAFSMAIDRQAIIDAVLPGRTPARSVVSPVVRGAREDACQDNCEFNPEQAKELFDQAGGFSGTLRLWFNSGAGHEAWMEAVKNQLTQNLGIQNVEFQTFEFADYLGKLDNEEVDGPFRLGWVMDYPSPQNYLEPIFSTDGSSNNFGYSNPEVDELIEQGNQAEDIDAGIEFYHQAEDLILEDLPAIPMFFNVIQAAHSDRVENVIVDAFTSVNVADIEVVEG